MTRQFFDRQAREWVDEDEYWFRKSANSQETARSDTFNAPYLCSDGMDPVQSQLDGRMYDSKSRLRATYREAGVVEVGNDAARLRKRPKIMPDRQAIRESIKKAASKAGMI